ncbi:hypothetical protein E6R62_04970 [Streptomyces sp. A1136]|nr:hypothetical protein E6R62_04970 [Streptomyces sp. A1136]
MPPRPPCPLVSQPVPTQIPPLPPRPPLPPSPPGGAAPPLPPLPPLALPLQTPAQIPPLPPFVPLPPWPPSVPSPPLALPLHSPAQIPPLPPLVPLTDPVQLPAHIRSPTRTLPFPTLTLPWPSLTLPSTEPSAPNRPAPGRLSPLPNGEPRAWPTDAEAGWYVGAAVAAGAIAPAPTRVDEMTRPRRNFQERTRMTFTLAVEIAFPYAVPLACLPRLYKRRPTVGSAGLVSSPRLSSPGSPPSPIRVQEGKSPPIRANQSPWR